MDVPMTCWKDWWSAQARRTISIIWSAYSSIRSGYWAISPQRSSSGARYSTPSFCTASNNLSSHLLLVAWSAGAAIRIGISSFNVRKTAAPRAPDEVSMPWNAGQMRSISDTTPSPAATGSDFATDLISEAASLSRLIARFDPRQP